MSIALFFAAVLLFAGSASSSVMAQQTTTTGAGTTTTPLLPSPPSITTGQTTTSIPTTPPLTPQEQEQLNRLQNVIAATNLNLDETEKQIGGIVYTPRWSDPVWVEPDSSAVLVAYCLPGEFAESGQEILGGGVGFELEVLESYEVALPQNFTAWMMVIGNEDRQNRYPAAVGVICASDANDAETRVVSPEEQQQINNVVQQFTTTTSIDQVINIINRNNNSNNNNATNQNTTGGGGTAPPASRDTTAPTLTVPQNLLFTTAGAQPVLYAITARDDVDGTATLDEVEEDIIAVTQDNVGGSITISCNPPPFSTFPLGDHTVQCSATDAAGNRGTASFKVSLTLPLTATANPAIYNNVPCPSPLEFSGTITDNVGNRDVRYRFIFSTGAISPVQTIHFDQPGSQSVSYRSPGIAPPSLQGWVAIEILEPTLQSNQAEMQIICTSSSGVGGITASLSANPANYEGPCPPPGRPTVQQWVITITDNVGNRDITYQYIYAHAGSSAVSRSAETVMHFDQPGSQSVTSYFTPLLGEGWAAIEILQPVQLESNRVEINVKCTPTTGGAAEAPQTLQAENDTTTATDEDDDDEDTAAIGQGGAGGAGGTDGEPAGTTTDAPSNGGGGTDGAGTDGEPAGTTDGTGAGEGTEGGTDAESPSE